MNIVILTAGSQGDIRPFVALGQGLLAAGHAATVCTHPTFEPLVTSVGLPFAPLDEELLQLAGTEAGRKAMDRGGNPLGLIRQARRSIRRGLDDAWAAAQDCDALVFHPKAMAGSHIAEKLGVPGVLSLPAPLYSPTRAFPSPLLPGLRAGGRLNRASFSVIRAAAAPYSGVVNEWRRTVLALPPRRRGDDELSAAASGRIPVAYSYSPAVVPRPLDWPASTVATGYWFLDEPAWEPPPDLVDFLDAGPPPVYVGFGSIAGSEPERRTTMVRDALGQAAARGIVATGWGGLAPGDLGEDVLVLREVSHEWLFPRVAAVVHHGGAGTTAAGLRAGRPTVVCAQIGDQLFWGRRVHDLGVGPEPITRRRLDTQRLEAAIRSAVTDPEIRRRADALGARIRGEDGVGRAVAMIKQLADRRRSAGHTPRAPDLPHVRIPGGPETLVVLEGPGMQNTAPQGAGAAVLRWIYQAFRERYTIYQLTRRPAMAAGATTADLAEDVAAWLGQRFASPVDVLGFSTGGEIAQHLAAGHPELVRRLVLSDTGVRISPEGRRLLLRVRALAAGGRAAEGHLQLARRLAMGPAGAVALRLLGPRLVREPADATDYIATIDADLAHDSNDRLRLIRAPTLVIGGTADAFYSEVILRETAELIPHATLRLYPGAGHPVAKRHKRAWERDVLTFLRAADSVTY